jgi:hypothetical protein
VRSLKGNTQNSCVWHPSSSVITRYVGQASLTAGFPGGRYFESGFYAGTRECGCLQGGAAVVAGPPFTPSSVSLTYLLRCVMLLPIPQAWLPTQARPGPRRPRARARVTAKTNARTSRDWCGQYPRERRPGGIGGGTGNPRLPTIQGMSRPSWHISRPSCAQSASHLELHNLRQCVGSKYVQFGECLGPFEGVDAER